MYDSLTKISS